MRLDIHDLKRRVSDSESALAKDRADIDTLKQIAESNKEIAELLKTVVNYAQKTYEVFHPLAKVATVVIKFGALVTIVWHGVKLVMAKIALVT